MRNPFKKKSAPRDFTGMIRSSRERPHRFAFLRKKWVLTSLMIVLVLGAGAAYGAWLYFDLQSGVQDDGTIADPRPPAENDVDPPFNVLLVGSDSRKGLTEEEQDDLGAQDVTADGTPIGGERADTLILAHVDPETDHVTMVQFPRDLYVAVADGGKSKINEALQAGNNNLLETVRDLTDLDIHHFAKVNIAGFRDLVDAIDGVEVCIPDPIPFDPQTGIEVPPDEVGMVEFDGDRALRFVRSRHFATGDFQRIQNQQKFLAAALDKITSPDTFLHFDRLLELRSVAKDNVEIDRDTTVTELYSILQRFRNFDPENYEAYTAPNLGTGSVDLGNGEVASIVEPDRAGLRMMFDAIADNESPGEADGVPDVKTASITVGVYNGTDVDGAAQEAAAELKAATTTVHGSVQIETVADALRQNYKETVVAYEGNSKSAAEKAELVAAAIPGATLKKGRTTPGIDVEVTVGRKFETKKITQIIPIKIPKPTELPEECQ
ncbi:MAG: LCP family protein [Actinomycetota bacterium]|nr:LCP family protein [Actinomycetota bacterium]